MSSEATLTFYPLTPDRWADFEKLLGPKGAYGGCWCMWWRLKRSDFAKGQGEGNKAAMHAIVESGEVPGLLAYAAGEPVGWCSVAPREAYPVLERSPVLRRVDDQPVWSIVCFFVARGYRRSGVMARLLSAAVEYAHRQGAQIVEGYPIIPKKDTIPDMYAYHGTVTAFKKAGFVEAARRSETHPIMRYVIET